jgi:hypothetical protein
LGSSTEQFLYLSTRGWKTGRGHRIEIWYVEHKGRYYVASERKEDAHWVQNISHDPAVSFSVAGKSLSGSARIISAENSLASEVAKLMEQKYGWGEGLIVELTPE